VKDHRSVPRKTGLIRSIYYRDIPTITTRYISTRYGNHIIAALTATCCVIGPVAIGCASGPIGLPDTPHPATIVQRGNSRLPSEEAKRRPRDERRRRLKVLWTAACTFRNVAPMPLI
jgi:hypothetical protein